MLASIFEYEFVRHAILASIFASIVCGVVGVIIVEKKLVMMSGGIAHTSYGGVGLGYLLGFEPIIGAFVISISAALGIGYIKRKGGTQSDVVIGLFWSLGMALGIVFIAMMPGYPPDLSSYLFGSLLAVTQMDLILIGVLTVVVVLAVVVMFSYWKAYLFDDEFAKILGINTTVMEYLLFVLIAMSVVVLIRVVGIILILALFTAPTAIAEFFTSSLHKRMLASVGIGMFFSLTGLWISSLINIPSGAVIIILAAFAYLVTLVVVKRQVSNVG